MNAVFIVFALGVGGGGGGEDRDMGMISRTDALFAAGFCGEREAAGRVSSAMITVRNVVCFSVWSLCVLAVCVCVVACAVGVASVAIVASKSFLKTAGGIVELYVRLFVLEKCRGSRGSTVMKTMVNNQETMWTPVLKSKAKASAQMISPLLTICEVEI
jgi:hypothetical protein